MKEVLEKQNEQSTKNDENTNHSEKKTANFTQVHRRNCPNHRSQANRSDLNQSHTENEVSL